MRSHALSCFFILAAIALALSAAGCVNPLGGSPPSVTVAATYVPPSPTPRPTILETPTPIATTWNGEYVKLHGNVSAKGGDHVYGVIKIYYQDKNYWDDHPTAAYDTDDGGAYSIEVRSNVSFIPEFGYYYFGRLPQVMHTQRLDKMTIREDTRLDYSVMTSNITPVY
jgi:hypothetical protein